MYFILCCNILQVCFLLRNMECSKRFKNRNSGIDASPQSVCIYSNELLISDI